MRPSSGSNCTLQATDLGCFTVEVNHPFLTHHVFLELVDGYFPFGSFGVRSTTYQFVWVGHMDMGVSLKPPFLWQFVLAIYDDKPVDLGLFPNFFGDNPHIAQNYSPLQKLKLGWSQKGEPLVLCLATGVPSFVGIYYSHFCASYHNRFWEKSHCLVTPLRVKSIRLSHPILLLQSPRVLRPMFRHKDTSTSFGSDHIVCEIMRYQNIQNGRFSDPSLRYAIPARIQSIPARFWGIFQYFIWLGDEIPLRKMPNMANTYSPNYNSYGKLPIDWWFTKKGDIHSLPEATRLPIVDRNATR